MSDKEFELKFTSKPPPTDPAEIHFKKAWQHRKFKRYPEAVDEFLKSLEYNPNKGATHFNLGLVYDQLNEGRLALAHVEKALACLERNNTPPTVPPLKICSINWSKSTRIQPKTFKKNNLHPVFQLPSPHLPDSTFIYKNHLVI